MFEHTFIGLDVHAVSVAGCALSPDTGELVQAKMDSDPAVVLEWIRRFEPPVKAVYESGPTGYVLARYLRAAGIDCVVAASSKLLRAPGDKVKTDKKDARVLAEMLALGTVPFGVRPRPPVQERPELPAMGGVLVLVVAVRIADLPRMLVRRLQPLGVLLDAGGILNLQLFG